MTIQYKLKGINDDHNTCDICGKVHLKKVMWLVEVSEEGDEISEAFPAGTTCGAKLLGIKNKSEARISQKVSEMAKEQVAATTRKICEFFIPINCMLVPPQFEEEFRSGRMTRSELTAVKEELWPILAYNNGRLSLEEAIKLA